jgi:hypothetical protein
MSDFNPTPENAVDLERSILDLKSEKAIFVAEKIVKQERVSEIKDILNDPKAERNELNEARRDRIVIKAELSELEQKIIEINQKIGTKRKLLIAVDSHIKEANRSEKLTENSLEKLNALKDKYTEFGADHTRVASMRRMAVEFTIEIEAIIKTI